MDYKICKEHSLYEKNMISTRKLGDSGCFSTFGKMWWNITKGALVIEKGDRICTLYLCPHINIIQSM